jgi:hypothetical protein
MTYPMYSVIADKTRNLVIITDINKNTHLSRTLTPLSWYQFSKTKKIRFLIAHTYHALARNTTTDLLSFLRKYPDLKVINLTQWQFV